MPAYNGPFVSTDLHLRALARVDKARFLAAQNLMESSDPVRLLATQRLMDSSHQARLLAADTSDANGETLYARIIHGILIIWTLVDIQREVSPGPLLPKYFSSKKVSITASASRLPSMSLLREKIAKRLLGRSAPRAEMSSASIITPEAASSPYQTSRLSSPSDPLEAMKRSEVVGQAQQSFVNALNRKARVDLQLAQEHLAEIMPWYNDHPENRAKSWWKEDWALRQGPEFMLAIMSRDKKERAWAAEWIEKEWKARPPGTRDPVACYTFCFPDPVDSNNQLQTISAEAWKIKSDALFAVKG